MGRPKKNRKKAPEETEKKGATFLSKHGVTIHCSVCRKPGHNKKGHDKYMAAQQHQDENIIREEDEIFDDPSIMQVLSLVLCSHNSCILLVLCSHRNMYIS